MRIGSLKCSLQPSTTSKPARWYFHILTVWSSQKATELYCHAFSSSFFSKANFWQPHCNVAVIDSLCWLKRCIRHILARHPAINAFLQAFHPSCHNFTSLIHVTVFLSHWWQEQWAAWSSWSQESKVQDWSKSLQTTVYRISSLQKNKWPLSIHTKFFASHPGFQCIESQTHSQVEMN